MTDNHGGGSLGFTGGAYTTPATSANIFFGRASNRDGTAISLVMDCDVGEVVFMETQPDSGVRQQVEAYLAKKWTGQRSPYSGTTSS